MNNEEQPKQKLTRAELLAKARQVKADKQKARIAEQEIEVNNIIKDVENVNITKTKAKPKPEAKVEVTELKKEVKEQEPEIVQEIVRIPANRRKKIVKRTIEIEESETDEEIVEEIVKIPKIKKEVKISRDQMKNKLYEVNKQRLHNELFS
jgi:hypothetical protein